MIQIFQKSLKWSLGIAVITLVLAALFSIVSTLLLSGLTWAVGMLVVLAIIFVGVIFDIVGVAATAADESPYHAMAAKKIAGAKEAILIVRNADRVANFCNDVIGDISGIVSGTAAAAVVVELGFVLGAHDDTPLQQAISVVFTSVVAALTVGGKAFGKTFAIRYSNDIIFWVGRIFHFFTDKLKFNITYKKRRPRKRKKVRK